MAKYIDAELLMKDTCDGRICADCEDMHRGTNVRTNCSEVRLYFLKAIEKQPAIDIVFCKDCRYNNGDHKCLNPESFFRVPGDNDFCSYGLRKED